jgi:ABC-type nitrate/sulfonate/bicarbonate transport system substrate-binding protein
MMNRNPLARRLAPALAVAVTIATAALAVGCGESSPPTTAATATTATTATTAATVAAPEVSEVDLMMDWSPWVLDIPIDVAQAMGFYEHRGLSVHQTLPVEATDVVKFVSTGKSQFGLYYAPDMLMALEAGAPLLSVGSLMSHAPVGMALRPGLTGDSPAALAGQTVSVPLIPSTRASFASMLSTAGVDPETVDIIDPGFELVAPLLKGTVAAAAFTEFGELVAAEAQARSSPTWTSATGDTRLRVSQHDHDSRLRQGESQHHPRLRAGHPRRPGARATPIPGGCRSLRQGTPELDQKLPLAQWKAAIPSWP